MKTILIKYGEIILKGLNRPVFENKLINNIKSVLGNSSTITKSQATIYIAPPDDESAQTIAEKCAKVFGVVSVCVTDTVEKDMNAIKSAAINIMKDKVGSYKVEAKRSDKMFLPKSPGISNEVGTAVGEAYPTLEVDVHNPDTLIIVEVRETAAYVYADKIKGVGGMPLGTSGKASLLLSGGIDSPVAGYMIAKRGVELECIHFYSYPYTSERAKNKVIELAKILTSYIGTIKINIVPFTQIQLDINANCPQEQMTIIMRRFMMKISERIAEKNGSGALITGESLGQVASQTMPALAITNRTVDLPVFRPLIGMDKDEIVKIARNIGTFETSILPYEDCCTVFTPKHPTTKPKFDKILLSEKKLDVERLIQEAVDGVEVIVV